MLREFLDNDEGYRRWLYEHLNGFVLNTYRNPSLLYLMLHRADCSHLWKKQPFDSFTLNYRKICTDELNQ